MLYGGLTLFASMAIGALAYFLFAAVSLFSEFLSTPDYISFDKGAFYLLGGSVGLAALIFAGIYESCLGRSLGKKLATQITRVAIVGIIIMLALPQVVHYFADNFLHNKGYEVCHEVSRRWLHSRTIVYVRNEGLCEELIEKEKNR